MTAPNRRFVRYLRIAAQITVASVALLTIVFLVRSYWFGDHIFGAWDGRLMHVLVGQGHINVTVESHVTSQQDFAWFATSPRTGRLYPQILARLGTVDHSISVLGVSYTSGTNKPPAGSGDPIPYQSLHLHLGWVLLGISLIFALTMRGMLVRRRRERMVRLGRCPNCEYDLRASSDHCPECGRQKQP